MRKLFLLLCFLLPLTTYGQAVEVSKIKETDSLKDSQPQIEKLVENNLADNLKAHALDVYNQRVLIGTTAPSGTAPPKLYLRTSNGDVYSDNNGTWRLISASASAISGSGSNGQLAAFTGTNSIGGITLGGDCTFASPNVTCTKTNGVSFSTLATMTPGTGVATALGVNVGSAGAFVPNGGALGTPSSGVATNLTGTAAGLTAGNVTTNANLTGVITSVGNATSIASQTGTGTKFVVDTSPTLAGTPAAPTAAVDTNTTQVATTAYVVGQSYLKSATAATTYVTPNATTNAIPYLSGANAFSDSPLFREDANTIGQRNSTTAQTLNIYSSYTNASNYEGLSLQPTTSNINISQVKAGTGSYRGVQVYGSGIGFHFNVAGNAAANWGIQTGGAIVADTDNAYDIGASGANRPRTGYFGTSLISPLVNATTGFQLNGAAASGNVLRGNGTNFVSAQLSDTDLTGSAWTAYTPTITCGTGTITTLGTVTGRYKQIGKTVNVQITIPITTNGTCATSVNATLPFTASAFDFFLGGLDYTNGKQLRGYITVSGTTVSIRWYDATYPGANSQTLFVSGVYESN